MSIERELLKNWTETTYQEPEVQLAAGPTDTMTDTGPAFNMPGMGKRSQKSEVGQNLPIVAADVAAGGAKGLVSGIAGFAGDIESLYQGVKGLITRGGDEGALDSFLKGLAQQTIAPTSEDVSKWLDANVGPVVPTGANMSPEMMKARQASAAAGEFVGQMAADPTVAIKGAKAVAKGAKALAPKAAEMIMDVTEKTGMPVKGLGIVESGSGDALRATAQASDIGFYSAVEQAALNIQRKSGTGQAMLNDITKGENVKADEIKWIGLDDFLKGKKNVSREEVQQFIAANKVDVKEVQLGGEVPQDYKKQYNEITDLRDRGGQISSDEWRRRITKLNTQYGFTPDAGPSDAVRTRYDRYTIPGGENYREILLTTPTNMSEYNKYADSLRAKYGKGGFANLPLTDIERAKLDKFYANEDVKPYQSSHFDQQNILAHIRVNDRVDADGKKMLLIEEVQSDWHQAGRDRGYGNNPQYIPGMEGNPDAYIGMREGVPDAPFKDTWYQLALKRALKYAADNGYERVGLTTGKQQADRFDLSKQVDNISYEPTDKGFYINIISKDGDNVLNGDYSVKELEGVVGKEVTQKMIAKEGKNEFDPKVEPDLTEIRRLEGIDLKVGGEGMKKYYDEVYPQFLAKYGKKWNASVGETRIKTGRGVPGGEPVKYIDITPNMKAGVGKGQPLFSATGLATGAGAGTMATSQQEPQ